jgi:hypothetical protein
MKNASNKEFLICGFLICLTLFLLSFKVSAKDNEDTKQLALAISADLAQYPEYDAKTVVKDLTSSLNKNFIDDICAAQIIPQAVAECKTGVFSYRMETIGAINIIVHSPIDQYGQYMLNEDVGQINFYIDRYLKFAE